MTKRCRVNDDPVAERKLVEDFTALIELAKPEEFAKVEGKILDRLEGGLSSIAAYRLLRLARARLLGEDGPGLSRVGRDGSLTPILPPPETVAAAPTEPDAW